MNSNWKQRYTREEDTVILNAAGRTSIDVALELNRTIGSVRQRAQKLGFGSWYDIRLSRKPAQDGMKWCKACKDNHPIGDFSPAGRFRNMLCKKARNQKLKQNRTRITRTCVCKWCKAAFTSRTSQQEYCSLRCAQLASQRRRWPLKTFSPQNCENCKKQFMPDRKTRKYCSSRCKDKALSKKYLKGRPPARKLECICQQCGQGFSQPARYYRKIKQRDPKFCSLVCAYKARQGSGSPFYRGGVVERDGEWKKQAKRVRERDGNCCQACHNDGTRFPVDHTVPLRLLKKWGVYCSDEMLATLCKSCHGKKYGPENRLLCGDVVGFLTGLRAMNYPEAPIVAAFDACGLPYRSAEARG